MYSSNSTNEKRLFLKFIFGIGLYVFRTVSLSIKHFIIQQMHKYIIRKYN